MKVQCSDGKWVPGTCVCRHVMNDPSEIVLFEAPPADGSDLGGAYCLDSAGAMERGDNPLIVSSRLRPVCWPCFERCVLSKLDLFLV